MYKNVFLTQARKHGLLCVCVCVCACVHAYFWIRLPMFDGIKYILLSCYWKFKPSSKCVQRQNFETRKIIFLFELYIHYRYRSDQCLFSSLKYNKKINYTKYYYNLSVYECQTSMSVKSYYSRTDMLRNPRVKKHIFSYL